MEIPGKPPSFTPLTNTQVMDNAQGSVAPKPDEPPNENDTVDLSANANEIREMVHKINDLPDVREEKVAELKRRIASGTYKIKNEQVASQMIGETVENNAILNHIDSLDD